MPEGDTIWKTAGALDAALRGRPVVRVEARGVPPGEVPEGTSVAAVEARGKHLLIRFADGHVLHTHMQMSGTWRIVAPSDRAPRIGGAIRAIVAVPGAVAVCRAAPTVELLRERDLHVHPRLRALGPDLTGPIPDLDEAVRRMSSLPSGTEVAEALLDQRVASGVGNVYKSEVLFARRVDPFATVSTLDEDECRALLATASSLLRSNLGRAPRSTVPGGLAVYGRARRPCRRCGTAISIARQGPMRRVTFWCPSCQQGLATGASA